MIIFCVYNSINIRRRRVTRWRNFFWKLFVQWDGKGIFSLSIYVIQRYTIFYVTHNDGDKIKYGIACFSPYRTYFNIDTRFKKLALKIFYQFKQHEVALTCICFSYYSILNPISTFYSYDKFFNNYIGYFVLLWLK